MRFRQIPLQGGILCQCFEHLSLVKELFIEEMSSVAGFYIRQKMLYARFILHLSSRKPIVNHIGNRQTQLPPSSSYTQPSMEELCVSSPSGVKKYT